jgi:hypothetical protein
VLWLGGFEGVPSASTKTAASASFKYSMFRAARAFLYITFFWWSDSVGRLVRAASSVVLCLATL